ncbi:MAG TPA: hypothetical protein VL993_07335 [Stellaceae bacterium]|nr:hypothetical protein [Stellaceae bacterium]
MTSRTRLGEILVDRGLLTDGQLALALEEQRRRQSGEPIGQVLVRLGFVDPDQLTGALTEQARRWVAASLTAGILAIQPGALAARTVSAQLSVSVEVTATASVTVHASPPSASASASAGNLSLACAGEPLMRVTYQRAHIEAQPAVAAATPYVPAPPAYKVSLQPLSQSLVPCGTPQASVAVTPPATPLHGDAMNVEIAY